MTNSNADDTSIDTDGDGLSDYIENNGYYLWERMELEDCIQSVGADHHQFNMTLSRDEDSDSSIEVMFKDDFTDYEYTRDPFMGRCMLEITGVGSISLSGDLSEDVIKAIEEADKVLLNSIDFNLYNNDAMVFPSTDDRTWRFLSFGDPGVEAGAVVYKTFTIIQTYDLIQADSVRLGLNDNPWGTFRQAHPELYTNFIMISSSFVELKMKGGLDPNLPDTDGDGLTDLTESENEWSPIKPDIDRDGLSDFEEVTIYETSPIHRDSDFDGLRDPIDLGMGIPVNPSPLTKYDKLPSQGSLFERRGRDMNPNTMYAPNLWISNRCPQPAPPKDPNNQDTDGDGLPDGCIDGWTRDLTEDTWYKGDDVNYLHDFWEGEDLDLDGSVDQGGWLAAQNPGESDPWILDSDGDELWDGWETWYHINPIDTNNPSGQSDGDEGDPDYIYEHPDKFNPAGNWGGDGLTNLEEFIAGTNPRCADTDYDDVWDANEVQNLPGGKGVIFRTNVPMGGASGADYGRIASGEIDSIFGPANYEWVSFYDHDPTSPSMVEYGYSGTEEVELEASTTPLTGKELDGDDFIAFLNSTTWISFNRSSSSIVIIRPDFSGDDLRTFEKLTYTAAQSQGAAPTACSIQSGYRLQEVYWTDPLSRNTDGTFYGSFLDFSDGLNDDMEWNLLDGDDDGLADARDIDSDQDTIQDSQEGLIWDDWDYDLDCDDVPNYRDTDSDGDGASDRVEILIRYEQMETWTSGEDDFYISPYEMDSDGDGLLDHGSVSVWIDGTDPHYMYYMDPERPIVNEVLSDIHYRWFYGEDKYGTNGSNPDTDNDLLYDAYDRVGEDGNLHHGEWTVGTDHLEEDTDGDTLLDGWEYLGWDYTVTMPDGTEIPGRGTSSPLNKVYGQYAGLDADTDYDGLPDRFEYGFTDGRSCDTDGDGLWDSEEDSDSDGEWDPGTESSPLMWDSDHDGMVDGWFDYNGDGTPQWWEGEDHDRDGYESGWAYDSETKPWDPDTDGDGVLDGYEVGLVFFRTDFTPPDSPTTYYGSGNWIALFVETSGGIAEGHRIPGLMVFEYVGYYSDTPNTLTDFVPYTLFGVDQVDRWGNAIYIDDTEDYSASLNCKIYILEKTTNKYIEFKRWSQTTKDYEGFHYPVWEYRQREVWFTRIANPNDPDTDDDGLNDFEEMIDLCNVDIWGLMLLDVDGDSRLTAYTPKWSPYDTDSDDDGIIDNKDPLNSLPNKHWNLDYDADGLPCALDKDSDGDGKEEGTTSQDDPSPITPSDDDDLDGIDDAIEEAVDVDDEGLYNPYDDNNDGDPDGKDFDHDGIIDGSEPFWSYDLDGDTYINAMDPDSDGDHLLDGHTWNEMSGSHPYFAYFVEHGIYMDYLRTEGYSKIYIVYGEDQNDDISTPISGETDPYDADSDNDGLVDGYEIRNGRRYGEIITGSDPNNPHSDADGIQDGNEVFTFHMYDSINPGNQFGVRTDPLQQSGGNQAVKVYNDLGTEKEYEVGFFILEPGYYCVEMLLAAGDVEGVDDDKADVRIKWSHGGVIMDDVHQVTIYRTYSSSRPETAQYPYIPTLDWWSYNGQPISGQAYVMQIFIDHPESDGTASVSKAFYKLYFQEITSTSVPSYEDYFYYILGDISIRRQGLNPILDDSDGDGIDDFTEGWLSIKSYPTTRDSDWDGLSDDEEIEMCLNPLAYDSDFDGVNDDDDMEPLSWYKEIRWKDTYSPGSMALTQKFNVVSAYNIYGGWDSDDSASAVLEETNIELQEYGFHIYDPMTSVGGTLQTETFTYDGGMSKYERKSWQMIGTMTNLVTKPAYFYNTEFEVPIKDGYDQSIVMQFSLLESEDKAAANDDFTIGIRYVIYPPVGKSFKNGQYEYQYLNVEPLADPGYSTCTPIDVGSYRTNRNAYEVALSLPEVITETLSVEETMGYGLVNVHLEIMFHYDPTWNQDPNHMFHLSPEQEWLVLDASKAKVRIASIVTTIPETHVAIHAPNKLLDEDTDFMEWAYELIPEDKTTLPTGASVWTITDPDGNSHNYNVIVLNELTGGITQQLCDDVENLACHLDPDNPEAEPVALDFVVLITRNEKDYKTLTTDTMKWKAKWSKLYVDEHDIEDPEFALIPNNQEGVLPPATTWMNVLKGMEFALAQNVKLKQQCTYKIFYDLSGYAVASGEGELIPGTSHYLGNMDLTGRAKHGYVGFDCLVDAYGDTKVVKTEIKVEEVPHTKQAQCTWPQSGTEENSVKISEAGVRYKERYKIGRTWDSIEVEQPKLKMMRHKIAVGGNLIGVFINSYMCLVVLEKDDYVTAVYYGSKSADDAVGFYAHYRMGQKNNLPFALGRGFKAFNVVIKWADSAFYGTKAVQFHMQGDDNRARMCLEQTGAYIALASTSTICFLWGVPVLGTVIAVLDIGVYLLTWGLEEADVIRRRFKLSDCLIYAYGKYYETTPETFAERGLANISEDLYEKAKSMWKQNGSISIVMYPIMEGRCKPPPTEF